MHEQEEEETEPVLNVCMTPDSILLGEAGEGLWEVRKRKRKSEEK